MRSMETVTNYEELKELTSAQNIDCELVAGHLIRADTTSEEGRKLCFLIGTLLTDHLMSKKITDRVCFGGEEITLDERNIYRPDLFAVPEPGKNNEKKLPQLVVEILSEKHVIYDCLDKAFCYMNTGIREYWLVDMTRQQVYVFADRRNIKYRRYSFEQKIDSTAYAGFSLCLSDVMWRDTGCLRQLALFYRFRQDTKDELKDLMVAEPEGAYDPSGPGKYTASMFYEWIRVRKNLPEIREKTELICGDIRRCREPSFRQQNIRGNLYFVIRRMLYKTAVKWQLCFAPTAVEMKQKGILDSVVIPDLFLMPFNAVVNDNVYQGVPPWIIEIATPASAATDYIDKAQIYQYHGVGEYWIINDWKRQVLVMRTDITGSMEMTIYDYEDPIPVEVLDGREIAMCDVMRM